jgi:hypothetical protein
VFRYFNAVLGVAAVIGLWWVLSLPNKDECLASGRVVDPTERHCESPAGFQQLEEHAWFHSREVMLGAALLWGGAFALHRRQRRKSAIGAPTA